MGFVPTGAGGSTFVAPPYVQCQNQQVGGTSGGTSSAGAWTDCALTTKVADPTGIATLTANHIALPAGTYECRAKQSQYLPDACKLRVRNLTDAVTLLIGLNGAAGPSAFGAGNSGEVWGQFTLAATKTIALQYWIANAQTTNGLGVPATSGEVEVYADIELWKVA